MKMQEVMEKVESFYFDEGEDSGEQMFNRFAEKYAAIFEKDCDATTMENKLEYTEAYNEYQKLFEKKIEEIIESCGMQADEFVKILQEKSKDDEDAEMFVQILLSVSEYENFVEMMRGYKKENNR